jgi:hypothetical protein
MSVDATDLAISEPADVTVPDTNDARSALAHYLGTGDLSRLQPEQRAALYLEICRSLAINPRTRPLDWIEFFDPETKGKKLVLYPNKTCTDQLAYLHRIRVRVLEEKTIGTLFKVSVEGTMPDGRTEQNVAYVDLTDAQGQTLRGQRYGNALMKGMTKAKRRLVLGMVGMSVPDDETLPRARRVIVDAGGNILERPTAEQRYLAEHPHAARAIGEPTLEGNYDVETGLEDEPETAPRPDPGPPKRTGPRPSFRRSDEDVRRLLGAFHAAVKGTSLEDDAGRHRYIGQWTTALPGWPVAKQTASSREFFQRATDAEAADLLAHTRAICDEERKAMLEDADAARGRRLAPDDDQPVDEDVEPF